MLRQAVENRRPATVTNMLDWAMRKVPGRFLPGSWISPKTVGFMLWAALGAASVGGARGDVVIPPPPDCVGKPDGTFCRMADGTAGKCTSHADVRRPGRNNTTCVKDPHECDRLAVGAECHGYLGKPAHCREFSNPERNERWRTCQLDEHNAGPAAGPEKPAPASTGADTGARADAPAATPVPPPPARRWGCSVVVSQRGGDAALFALLMVVAALPALRRRAAMPRARA